MTVRTVSDRGIRLPVEPLLPYLREWEGRYSPGSTVGVLIRRAVDQGWISVAAADKVAITFGKHPALIWGDLFYVGVQLDFEDEE